MAQAGVGHDLTDFDVLCSAACQQNPVEITNTEVVASILLDNVRLMGGTRAQSEYAHAILNAHMENFQDVMDEQEELDERIAFGMSVTPKDTNDGGSDYEPVLSGRSPTAAAAAAPAATEYTNLISFVNNLKSPDIAGQLISNMVILNYELIRICQGHAYVYNNILFFTPTAPVTIRDTSLFPKYSFNILCNQNSFLLPQLLVLGERGVGSILQFFVCNVFNRIFRDYVNQEVIQFKIFNPTETNKLWQVKICLFGNEFTFISIQIISMSLGFFIPEYTQNDANLELTTTQALCFSLYNKCLSKDFNCLCSLSELDINLFRAICSAQNNIVLFTNFIKHFFDNLSETQLNVKKQYFIMGLYNVASCSSYPNYTPETKAYELLFDRAPDGIDLFNKSMCFIKGLNQQTPLDTHNNPVFPEQIRFAMGGGKLYSIFQKKLQEICSLPVQSQDESDDELRIRTESILRLRDNVSQNILTEFIKAAADADFGCFYPEPQQGIAARGIGASSCMAICMLLQLSLKQLIDRLFAPPAPWYGSEIDIGNSCIGTPPSTLSSLRIVLKNIRRFYLITNAAAAAAAGAAAGAVAAGILAWLQGNFNLGDDITNSIKATISPYDFVMKGSMKSYIFHIFEAVHSYMNTRIDPAFFPDIADFLTRYCMVTLEGFSSPIKGILDIFYTLFIIENFANRTFVTQKINKELKRVAICAQILFLHYTELLPQIQLTQQILPILRQMIGYGYGSDLLGDQFGAIMTTYVQFVSFLCSIYITNPNYLYFSVAGVAIPRVTRQITTIETSFMNLLSECEQDVLNLPVFTQTITQYTPIIQALATMGPLRPDPLRPATNVQTAQATTDLYLNKLYASCRDAENKKNGIVAIMSAYQAFLWDKRKIDMIRRNVFSDKCRTLNNGIEGIVQHLVATLNVFNNLLGIITVFANTDVLGMAIPIREINAHDILLSRIANAVPASLNTFLVFSWFITSVFGVKTKSKPSKIISLGRTYLRLLIDSPPEGLRPYPLFGLPINIPDAAAVAAVAAVGAVIDNGIVPEVEAGQPVGIATGHEQDRLCLAYSSGHIFGMAINKYIKMDIDMIVDAARVTALAAAADFDLVNAQRAAVDQVSNDVKQVPSFELVIPQPAGAQQPEPVMVYPLSVATASRVFNQEIFSELITRFSHLPRGNQYILGAARYMRPIMLQICEFIDRRNPANIRENITEYMNSIRELPYPYRPALHDTSKFTMLNDGMRNAWLQYLINKIFVVGVGEVWDPQTVFDNMKLFVLLYNYIGPVNEQIIFPNPPPNVIYFNQIGALIFQHFKVCEPVIGVTEKKLNKKQQQTAETALSRPIGVRIKEAAAMAATIRDARRNEKRTTNRSTNTKQGGGNTNNHTRRNKNKRKKNSKTKTKFKTKSSPKHKKVIPSSRSGSQSNRKKSKPKKSQKNVTFKRRRARK